MSEEEIHKALEIIGQPITVNHKEYHYFDQENYDKLVAVYQNCLWFIRNFEQINTTVERLQQENQQLKDKVDLYKEVIEEVRKEIYEYKKIMEDGIEKGAYYSYLGSLQQRLEKLLQILDKVKENK